MSSRQLSASDTSFGTFSCATSIYVALAGFGRYLSWPKHLKLDGVEHGDDRQAAQCRSTALMYGVKHAHTAPVTRPLTPALPRLACGGHAPGVGVLASIVPAPFRHDQRFRPAARYQATPAPCTCLTRIAQRRECGSYNLSLGGHSRRDYGQLFRCEALLSPRLVHSNKKSYPCQVDKTARPCARPTLD